jgi:LysM repeat protein
VNWRDFAKRWLTLAILLSTLLLVACERPLQEDITLEAETPQPLEPTPGTVPETEPGEQPGESPGTGLEPTPSPAAQEGEPGAEPGADPGAETGGEGTAQEPEATTAPPPATEPGPAEDVVHTVVAGETLGRIAQAYGVSVEDIAAANNIVNINSLEVGQQLLIPLSGDTGAGEGTAGEATGEEQVHVVGPGDTLFSIGRRFGFTVDELVAYNNLADPNRLEVGQQIRIPPQGWTPGQ